MIMLSFAIATLGMMVLLIAALGLLRLPDALARQHAATKAGTIAITLFIIGLMLFTLASEWGAGWLLRLSVILVCLLGALPMASHALARAGAKESNQTTN